MGPRKTSKPRVAAYVRLSRESDASTSPERQRALIADLAERKGWELVEVFEDLGRSGKSADDRPSLSRLRARLDEFDILAVWKLDRLARNVADLSRIGEECTAAWVAIVSEAEAFDMTTPMGRAMAQMLGVMGEFELATIRERIVDGQAAQLKAGRWKGGTRPFGWEPAPAPGGAGYWLVLKPSEADILREVVDRALGGESLQAIAVWLNSEGVPTAQRSDATKWSRTAVRQLLLRRGLMGHAVKNGETVYDDEGAPVIAAEPLLDRDTFDRLQEAVRTRRRSTASGERRYLAGLVSCEQCGSRLWTKPRHRTLRITGETVTDHIFQCSAPKAADYTGPPCSGCAILADRLEAEVERLFLETFGRLSVVERTEVRDEHAEERANLSAALEDLGRSLVGLRSEVARATVLSQIEAIDARLQTLGP